MKACPACNTYNQLSYSICTSCGAELPKSNDGGTYFRGAGQLAKEAGTGIGTRILIRIGVFILVFIIMSIYYAVRR